MGALDIFLTRREQTNHNHDPPTQTHRLMYLVQQYDEMLLSTTMASVMVILVTDAVLSPLLQVRPPWPCAFRRMEKKRRKASGEKRD